MTILRTDRLTLTPVQLNDLDDLIAKLESHEQLQAAWERLWTARDQGVLEVLVIQVKPTVDRRGRRDSVPQLPEGHRGTEVMTVRLDFEDEKLSTQECARTVAGLEAAVRARVDVRRTPGGAQVAARAGVAAKGPTK